jgi:hypothetical protein
LPACDVEGLFPGFSEAPVSVSLLPRGSWSTPLSDQVTLAKLAKATHAKKILEVGSFRGYTARMLAENLPSDGVLHSVDMAIEHGEAYRDRAIASRIERHVGSVDEVARGPLLGHRFDLIFLDADHSFSAVRQDSAVLLPLLADSGLFVWHDYADWGWMSGWNRVPEVLAELASTMTIVAVPGTSLAVHSRHWSPERIRLAQESWHSSTRESPWNTNRLRGDSM